VQWTSRPGPGERVRANGFSRLRRKRSTAPATRQTASELARAGRRWMQDYYAYDAWFSCRGGNDPDPCAATRSSPADLARFGGANQDLLGRAFGRCTGFGSRATHRHNADANPVPCVRRAGDRHQQRHDQLSSIRRRERGSVQRADLRGGLLVPATRDADKVRPLSTRGRTPSNLDNFVQDVPNGAARSRRSRRGESQVGILQTLSPWRPATYGQRSLPGEEPEAGEVRNIRSTFRRTTRRRRRRDDPTDAPATNELTLAT